MNQETDMTTVDKNPDQELIKTTDHGTGAIDLSQQTIVAQWIITEIHHKSDGAIDNKPSFCFVMKPQTNHPVGMCTQVTLTTLNNAMMKLGYVVRPLNSDDHE